MALPSSKGINQGNVGKPVHVMPDFAQVYNFIGSVFDPNSTNHLQRLKRMDPINVETKRLLSSYDAGSEKENFANPEQHLNSFPVWDSQLPHHRT